MSGDAVKAYVYLLAESWLQIPRATLPRSDKDLASMARVTSEKWETIKEEVLQHFLLGNCKEHSGRLFNELLLEISRNGENKQRFNNKNAKRSQINTEKPISDNDNDNEISSLNSSSSDSKGASSLPEEQKTWRTDFEFYRAQAEAAFLAAHDDPVYIAERQTYHPGLDVPMSIQKAFKDFWGTEAGWHNKKASRTKNIDWKATINRALSAKMNQVWIPKCFGKSIDELYERL